MVSAVYVQEGDRVVAGQMLARQEDDDPRLAVARASAQVAQAQAQIGVMQVKLDAARREYARLESLSASNFVARQRLDQQNDADPRLRRPRLSPSGPPWPPPWPPCARPSTPWN